MTHTIEFAQLHDLIADLNLDAQLTTPIRVSPVSDRISDKYGVSHEFTFYVTVRAINQAGHILTWAYTTGKFATHIHDKNGRSTYDQQWDKLQNAVQSIQQWLQTSGVTPTRIRPGHILLDQPERQSLQGHWPIQKETEAQS